MKNHKEVEVRVGETIAMVDEGIAPLIQELWNAFIETEESCEKHSKEDDTAFLHFPDIKDYEKLLKIIAFYDYGEMEEFSDLYQRAFGYNVERNWSTYLISQDYRHMPVEYPSIGFEISLEFPCSDIPILTTVLKDFNSRRSDKRSWRKIS